MRSDAHGKQTCTDYLLAVTLMEEARPFIIAKTYTWPRFEENTLRVKFTPGVAYAVSKYFDDLPTDGLLGLEPSKYANLNSALF